MKYLVFDIGGSFIKVAVIDEGNTFHWRDKIATPTSLADLSQALKQIVKQHEHEIGGIAFSMPGRIDAKTGYAHSAGYLKYLENVNLVDVIHQFTPMDVSVENDGKCAALAEAKLGALKGIKDGVVLVFGTGVGGGVIINGALHRGHHSAAGEFSFILESTREKGASFGVRGSAVRFVDSIAIDKGMDKGTLTGEEVFEMIHQNDPLATQALEDYCDRITLHIFNLQYIYDPQCFAIGGGISAQSRFIQCLQERMDLFYQKRPYNLLKPKIVPCMFRNDANLLGALVNFHLNRIKA